MKENQSQERKLTTTVSGLNLSIQSDMMQSS